MKTVGTTPNPRANPNRFDIDPLRGLVCLSLVGLHFYTSVLHDRFQRLLGSTGEYVFWNLRLGVESFFVLAGLLLAHSLRPTTSDGISIGLYLKRRFFRLVLPYWIIVGIAAANLWLPYLIDPKSVAEIPAPRGLGHYFWRTLHADPPTLGTILVQAFFIEEFFLVPSASPALWSMVVLEQFYLLWIFSFWLMSRLLPKQSTLEQVQKAMLWPTFIACVAAGVWILYRASRPEQFLNSQGKFHLLDARFNLSTYGTYLCVGMLLYWAVRQPLGPHRASKVACVLVVLLLTGIAWFTFSSRVFAALITIALLIPLMKGQQLPNYKLTRFLAFWGRCSFSVYLVHGLVGHRFLLLERVFQNTGDWIAYPLFAGAFLSSLAASWLFHRWIETPCQKLAQKIDYRSSSRKPPKPKAMRNSKVAPNTGLVTL